jgi:hypothetical protein
MYQITYWTVFNSENFLTVKTHATENIFYSSSVSYFQMLHGM